MNTLTKLEFKKIISNKAFKVAYALSLLYIIITLVNLINSENYFKSGNSEIIENVTGIDAIKEKRNAVQELKGYIDANKITEVINYYKELKSNKDNLDENGMFNDTTMAKYWQPYLDLHSSLINAYSDLHKFDYNIIDTLTPADSKEFYNKRIEKLNNFLNLYYEHPQFTKNDSIEIIKQAKHLEEPIYYEYSDGWIKLIDNFFSISVIIILITCFCICTVFTEDIQTYMTPIVRSTINGKTKIAFAKVKASVIFATTNYLSLNLLFTLSLLGVYGISGWNCVIQVDSLYWLSIYNVKFYQAYILATIIGLTCCIFMVLVTLLLETLLKKSFVIISVTSTLFLLPLLINTEELSKTPANLIEIFPIKAINFSHTLIKPSIYNIGGINILRGYITPIILLIISVAIIPFIIKIYNNQELE